MPDTPKASPADGGVRPTALAWRWTCVQWAVGVAGGLVLYFTRLLPPPILAVWAIHLANVGLGLFTVRRALDAVREDTRSPSALAACGLAAAALVYWCWSLVTGGPLLL